MKKKVISILCGMMFVILAGSIYFVTRPDQARAVVMTNVSEEAFEKSQSSDSEKEQETEADFASTDVQNTAASTMADVGSGQIENESNSKSAEESFSKQADEPVLICVYVCGAVKSPGVYYFSEDARAVEAIEAAGGFSDAADQDYINLARTISDGEKLYVPTMEETKEMAFSNLDAENQTGPSQNGATSEQQTKASGKVNINTAGKEELMTLNGIGEAKAESIISYRDANGLFQAKEDIMNITGIKDALYQKIADYICVTNEE